MQKAAPGCKIHKYSFEVAREFETKRRSCRAHGECDDEYLVFAYLNLLSWIQHLNQLNMPKLNQNLHKFIGVKNIRFGYILNKNEGPDRFSNGFLLLLCSLSNIWIHFCKILHKSSTLIILSNILTSENKFLISIQPGSPTTTTTIEI